MRRSRTVTETEHADRARGRVWMSNSKPTAIADFLTSTALPPWLSFSRAGNAMMYDATGKLTYAPNNLLTFSNTFDNAVWTKLRASVVTGATIDPDGALTAYKLIEDTSTNTHLIYSSNQAASFRLGSIYVKAAERTKIGFGSQGGLIIDAKFDLSTGQFIGSPGGVTAQNIGNGWYRLAYYAADTVSNLGPFVYLLDASGNSSYTGDGASGVYICRAQLEAVTYQTTPSAYMPTGAAAYYGPRFDYDPSTLAPKGLLLEGAATNRALQSGAIGTTPWTLFNSATVAQNSTISPDGTQNASTLTFIANRQSQIYLIDTGFASGTTVTFSVWAKSSSGKKFCFKSNSNSADAYSSDFTTTSVWQRFSFTTVLPAVSGNYAISNSSDALAGSIDVYGFQAESGAFMTSYIPAGAARVTRAADVAAPIGAALAALEGGAASVFAELQAIAPLNSARIIANQASKTVLSINNDTTDIFFDSIAVPNSTVSSLLGSAAKFTTGARCGSTWGATGSSICGNGGTVATTPNPPVNVTAASLGIWFWLKNMAIYNRRLPDAQLQAMSIVGATYQ